MEKENRGSGSYKSLALFILSANRKAAQAPAAPPTAPVAASGERSVAKPTKKSQATA